MRLDVNVVVIYRGHIQFTHLRNLYLFPKQKQRKALVQELVEVVKGILRVRMLLQLYHHPGMHLLECPGVG